MEKGSLAMYRRHSRSWYLDLADRMGAEIRRYVRNEGREAIARGQIESVRAMLQYVERTRGIPWSVYAEISAGVMREVRAIQRDSRRSGLPTAAHLVTTVDYANLRKRWGLRQV
jgi:hypothetical protein